MIEKNNCLTPTLADFGQLPPMNFFFSRPFWIYFLYQFFESFFNIILKTQKIIL